MAQELEEGLNPEELAEHYEAMSEKYFSEAEEFLEQGEFAQASEKLWGAAASAVKALAARRREKLDRHGSLWDFVSRLAREREDEELLRLFYVANGLHRNFYEDQIKRREPLEAAFKDIKRFVDKLREAKGKG